MGAIEQMLCFCSMLPVYFFLNNMNTKPLSDRVLIEPISKEDKTKSGIILPDTADKERPEQGKVIALGGGKVGKDGKTMPMSVKKGDVVLFTKYGPNEIKIDDK